jgi:hypothetical protein
MGGQLLEDFKSRGVSYTHWRYYFVNYPLTGWIDLDAGAKGDPAYGGLNYPESIVHLNKIVMNPKNAQSFRLLRENLGRIHGPSIVSRKSGSAASRHLGDEIFMSSIMEHLNELEMGSQRGGNLGIIWEATFATLAPIRPSTQHSVLRNAAINDNAGTLRTGFAVEAIPQFKKRLLFEDIEILLDIFNMNPEAVYYEKDGSSRVYDEYTTTIQDYEKLFNKLPLLIIEFGGIGAGEHWNWIDTSCKAQFQIGQLRMYLILPPPPEIMKKITVLGEHSGLIIDTIAPLYPIWEVEWAPLMEPTQDLPYSKGWELSNLTKMTNRAQKIPDTRAQPGVAARNVSTSDTPGSTFMIFSLPQRSSGVTLWDLSKWTDSQVEQYEKWWELTERVSPEGW